MIDEKVIMKGKTFKVTKKERTNYCTIRGTNFSSNIAPTAVREDRLEEFLKKKYLV